MNYSSLLLRPVTAVLLCTVFLSCTKNKAPAPKATSQTLLTKTITHTSTTSYEYNTDNRVIKFTAVFSDPTNNYSGSYTYNNSGQLVEIFYAGGATTADTKDIFSYSGSGQMTKIESYVVTDGVATLDTKTEADYSTPAKISVYTTRSGETPYLSVVYFLDAKGNITKQLSYNQEGLLNVTTENLDFDDKHAANLSIPPSGFARNINNYQKVVVTVPGGSPSTNTYTYAYNHDGYPTKRTVNTGSRTTYEYRKQ